MGTDRKRYDPTYAALASGPGSFRRALEAAIRQPPRSMQPPQPPPLPEASARDAVNTVPQGAPPRRFVNSRPSWAEVPLGPDKASAAYLRVLEELSTFVVPPEAHALLQSCLDEEGVSPAEAVPYDLRAILVEALPLRLEAVLSPERATSAVESLEQTLVSMYAPPTARRRRSSSGDLPAMG
jgi:hypothetical protein